MAKEEALQKIQHLVGSRYVHSVKAYISELTGYPRVAGPNDVTTKEIASDRIIIMADDTDNIVSFNFT